MTARALAFLRHAAAFAVAPAVAPIAFLAFELVRLELMSARPDAVVASFAPTPLALFVSFATTWVPAAYAIAFVLGLPIVLTLRAARRLTVAWVVCVSAATACAFTVGAAFLASGGRLDAEDLVVALVFAGIATLLAAGVSGAYCAVAGVPLRGSAAVPKAAPAT